MASGEGEIPAIESGTSSGIFGALSSPIGMTRRNISYDELMEAPMYSPPSDMTVNILWKDPVHPRTFCFSCLFLSCNCESGRKLQCFEPPAPAKSPVPVVRAKATSLMNSLMIKQTQENLQRFEHQAGLTDARYSPHKGLSAEETRFHRLGDGTLPVSMNRCFDAPSCGEKLT
uniref:Putative monooxygenase p33MONOX n=1 Tax=Mola mola TaxID=94237 RepID=A0A3Q3VYC7_MOLML